MTYDNEKLAYSIAEAAKAISLSRATLYRLIGSGEIKTRKVAGRTLIPASALRSFIEAEAA